MIIRRALDHIATVVHDLDQSGEAWSRLGFQVLPKMKHLAIGSSNRVIQLGCNYIELIGDLDNLIEPYKTHYRSRFAYGEGMANIAFDSADLHSDHVRLVKAGIRVGPISSARRPVIMPNGVTMETDSDFFNPWRDGRAFMTPFLVVHHRPETIFTPEYQKHPNTALEIVGITCFSSSPREDAEFFALLSNADLHKIEGGYHLKLAKDQGIDILTPEAVRHRLGRAIPPLPEGGSGLGLGITVKVASLQACRRALGEDIAFLEAHNSIVIPAKMANGVAVSFVEV